MSRLKVKNIGSISEIDITINRYNIIIGAQSSGKSTFAKILCHCQWIEKTCFLNKRERKYYRYEDNFYNSLIEFHRLDGYFHKTASIRYEGDYLKIVYIHSSRKITIEVNKKPKYAYPKISFIPSERNLIGAVSNIGKFNDNRNDSILNFGYDWSDARKAINSSDLSKILDRKLCYKQENDIDYIVDNGNTIKLQFASSGVLSYLPLHICTQYLCNAVYNKDRSLSPYRKDQVEVLKTPNLLKKPHGYFDDLFSEEDWVAMYNDVWVYRNNPNTVFNYKHTNMFIEEPEQNVFPSTQLRIVNELFMLFNSNSQKHNAVITTHSPYILFEINNCIMRHIVKDSISDEMKSELLDNKAMIDPKDISIYQIENGKLKRIQDEDGNLDENFINDAYKDNSSDYFSLLNFYEDEE